MVTTNGSGDATLYPFACLDTDFLSHAQQAQRLRERRREYQQRLARTLTLGLATRRESRFSREHVESIDSEIRRRRAEWMRTGQRPKCGLF